MFRKENRLTKNVSFKDSFSYSFPQFIFKQKENNLNVNRFGIVVSKKIDKKAVGRNKIKRFFRDALINLYKNMASGHDILLIIKSGILGKTEEENRQAIREAIVKAGLIKK